MKALTGKILVGTAIVATAVIAVVYTIDKNEDVSVQENQQTTPVSDVQKSGGAEVNSDKQNAEITDEERAKELYNNPPTNVNGQTENQTR